MSTAVPMRHRIVEVEVDLGNGRWRYGSGLLLGRRQVLTCAHVLTGPAAVAIRSTDKVQLAARTNGALVGDPDRLDLALFEVPDADVLPAVAVARVNRDVTGGETRVEDCWAVGYPEFAEVHRKATGRSLRESEAVHGVISPLSGLAEDLLLLEVTARPESLAEGAGDRSQWSGMSGAAVYAGDFLIGVVTEHAPCRGTSEITLTPLERLLNPATAPSDASEWWARLGVVDPQNLPALPLSQVRREPVYRAVLRDMRGRTQVLVGREKDLDRIAAFATGNAHAFGPGVGANGYLWLVGGPWTGKSALLAEAVYSMPPEVDVVAFFLVARESRASRERFLEAVVPQLAFLLDEDPPAAVNEDTFRAMWDRASDQVEADERHERHLLLVVDGLDEDLRPLHTSVAALLPERLGKRARVVVASRPYPGMPEQPDLPYDVALHHPLRAAAARSVVLSDSTQATELRILADQEIAALLSPMGSGPDASLAFDVLGLLAAAGGALAVEDLTSRHLTGAETHDVWSFVSERAARSLETVGPVGHRRYQFAHQTLLDRCRAHPIVGDRRYWDRLTVWADEWRERRWPPPSPDDAGTPRYLFDTYPAVLAGNPPELYHGASTSPAKNGEPRVSAGPSGDQNGPRRSAQIVRLAALLSDVAWVDGAVSAVGVDSVLAALRAAVRVPGIPTAVSSMLQLVELQAHQLRPPRPSNRPGFPATQLGWEALRVGNADLAAAADERLRSCPGPKLIPRWTTEYTSTGQMRTLGRHDGEVEAVAVTSNGWVVSGGFDGTVRLWDPTTPGDPGRELGRHDGWVAALAVTTDGRAVSAGSDGAVRLWDPAAPGDPGREVGRRDFRVSALAIAPDGRVVWGGDDGVVWLWDPASPDDPGRELGRHQSAVLALAVASDGRVVSSGDDGVVWLWDPASPDDPGRELGRRDYGDYGVFALAVAADGKVVWGYSDGVVWLWDPASPDDPGREVGRHDGLESLVSVVAVTADGRVVSAGADGAVWLWDPASPDDPGQDLGRDDGWVWTLAVTADGSVVWGGGDGAVWFWDPTSPDEPARELGRHDNVVRALAITADGQVVSGGMDGQVRLWDPAAANDSGRESGRHDRAVTTLAGALAVTADGRVVSGDNDGTVWLWDPAVANDSGRALGRHDGAVRALAVIADGRVVSGGFDGAVRLWDPATPGEPGWELGRLDDAVGALAATSDGWVVSGGFDGAVRLWDEDPGWELGRHDGKVLALAVTSDGRVVSGCDDGTVRLWDPSATDDSGRELGRHDGWVLALGVTSNGQVVSGGMDGQVRLWDPASSGDPGRELGHHDGTVGALAVTSNGWVVSGGSDGVVRLLDPAAADDPGRELGRQGEMVEALAVTANGHVVIGTARGISALLLIF